MKKVTIEQYEKGDCVKIISGYNRGKIGIVQSHRLKADRVSVAIAGHTYDDDADDYWDDDEDYMGDYTLLNSNSVKYITKQEYDRTLKSLKVINIPGLPVGVRFQGTNLIIGDNVITPANAKQLAEFINEHTKGKKK